MPIRPIDFQVIVPKSAEANKINNEQQNKNRAFEQQQQNINAPKDAASKVKNINKKENAQEARIRKKEKEEDKNRKKKKKKKNNDDKGSSIDIKV
jgi:negative regulator of genetic competence, sporulation and motility